MKELLKSKGYVINNIDSTVIIEKTILRPFIDLMCETIAFHL